MTPRIKSKKTVGVFVKVIMNFITLTLIATTLYTLFRPTLTYTYTFNSKLGLPYTHVKQTSTNTTLSHASVQCSKSRYNKTNIHQRHTVLLLLLLCGDTGAVINPGPYQPKYPCVICSKAVKWRERGPFSVIRVAVSQNIPVGITLVA